MTKNVSNRFQCEKREKYEWTKNLTTAFSDMTAFAPGLALSLMLVVCSLRWLWKKKTFK
jgi:hypothetical protein